MGRGTMYDRLERKGATREIRRNGVSKRRYALSNSKLFPRVARMIQNEYES
jgi:hypothetical protein